MLPDVIGPLTHNIAASFVTFYAVNFYILYLLLSAETLTVADAVAVMLQRVIKDYDFTLTHSWKLGLTANGAVKTTKDSH